MKALSIKEPWASMIVNGEKRIEYRSWKTNFRGPVLFCASSKPKGDHSGMAFGVATINKVVLDKEDGQWEWHFSFRGIHPFPVKGRLGLFNLEVNYEQLKFVRNDRNVKKKVGKK